VALGKQAFAEQAELDQHSIRPLGQKGERDFELVGRDLPMVDFDWSQEPAGGSRPWSCGQQRPAALQILVHIDWPPGADGG